MLGWLLAGYFIIVNLTAFCAMGRDKRRARRRQSRTPEKTLIGLALFGGSVGAILGMLAFRHKTKHRKFTLGLPLILLAQIAVVVAAVILL